MSWTWIVVLLAIAAAVAIAARPVLARLRQDGPDRARLAVREVFRDLVPMPAPSVRTVTKRVVAACRRQRVQLPFGGRCLLPDAYEIGLSAPEYDAIADYLPLVTESVAETLTRQAKERDWSLSGPPMITIERDETAQQGAPRVRARATRPTPPPPVASDQPARPGHREPDQPDRPGDRGPAPVPPRPRVEPGLAASGLDPSGLDTAVASEPTQRFAPVSVGPPAQQPPAATATNGVHQRVNGVQLHSDDGRELTRTERAGSPRTTGGASEPTGAEPPPARHRLESYGAHPAPDVVLTTSVTVGRGADCDIVVGYPAASRRHVRLDAVLAGCLVTDLGSTHGTYVDGEAIQAPTLLRSGQSLRLGRAGPTWVYRPT